MNSVHTDATTTVLGAPANWNAARDGECVGLPIVQEGQQLHSFWQPDEEERRAIAQGGMIRLTVFGTGHPPVMLAATVPPEEGACLAG